MSDVTTTEYLYGIDSSVNDDDRYDQGPQIVQFRITKKTPKRIYYIASEDWEHRSRIGFVNRQRIEADGEVYQHGKHWSSPQFHLYLEKPNLNASSEPSLDQLKAAMRAAHPDMGGSHEAFLAAHKRYEQARAKAAQTVGER